MKNSGSHIQSVYCTTTVKAAGLSPLLKPSIQSHSYLDQDRASASLKWPGKRVLTSRGDSPWGLWMDLYIAILFLLFFGGWSVVTSSISRYKKGKQEQKEPREVKTEMLGPVNDQEVKHGPTNCSQWKHSLELQQVENALPPPLRGPKCIRSGKVTCSLFLEGLPLIHLYSPPYLKGTHQAHLSSSALLSNNHLKISWLNVLIRMVWEVSIWEY